MVLRAFEEPFKSLFHHDFKSLWRAFQEPLSA